MPDLASRGAEYYRRTEVQSRTPLELVVMLYDAALQSLARARGAIERNDVAARRDAISRAIAIVSELQNTLDMESGGTVAESLDRLYNYVNGRLIDASFKRDVIPVDEAVHLLTPLRDAWASIARDAPAPGVQATR